MPTLADLEQLRQVRRLPVAVLARWAGINRRTVARLERDPSRVSLPTAVRILEALDGYAVNDSPTPAFSFAPLRAVRAGLGYSRAEVAARAGISTTTVARLERGQTTRPALAEVQALAGALGVDLNALYIRLPEGAGPLAVAAARARVEYERAGARVAASISRDATRLLERIARRSA